MRLLARSSPGTLGRLRPRWSTKLAAVIHLGCDVALRVRQSVLAFALVVAVAIVGVGHIDGLAVVVVASVASVATFLLVARVPLCTLLRGGLCARLRH
jgi:hypothetical protein